MKINKKEVVTYKNIYISDDGREFEDENSCKEWEKSYKGTLNVSWNLIKKISVDASSIGFPGGCSDEECYVLRPKNMDEIIFLNAYIRSSTGYNTDILNINHIGKMIVLNFGYDHDYCSCCIVEELIKDISNYASKLETNLDKEMQE